jgi:hypothetical protein
MATVKRRGKAWQATVRGPDGRERTKTFRLQVEAERWADCRSADKARGEWVDPSNKLTVAQYADSWTTSQLWRPSTAEGTRRRLELHILPALGGLPLTSLRPSTIQSW